MTTTLLPSTITSSSSSSNAYHHHHHSTNTGNDITSSQSPDSGIVVGTASFSSNDSSLSPCAAGGGGAGIHSDAPTSSSDVQSARRRSKSLPELDSAGENDGNVDEERPASVEGVVKDSAAEKGKQDGAAFKSTKVHSSVAASNGSQQRGRLSSTPAMRGTIPLSHAPSLPPQKGSLASTPFAVPRMNYSSMHAHTGSYGAVYPNFPSYQSYNMTAGMPTQSAYPPTYNPYTGSTGSAYLGPSSTGTSGSALYHQNTPPPAYPAHHHHNMINYMPYPNTLHGSGNETRQAASSSPMHGYGSTHSYNSTISSSSSGPPPLLTPTTTGSYSGVENMSSQSPLSHLSTPSTSDLASVTTRAHTVSSNAVVDTSMNPDLLVSREKSTSNSPQNPSGGASAVGVSNCDSTTHINSTVPPSNAEDKKTSASEEKADGGGEIVELQYYSTRYVYMSCPLT